MSQWLKEIFNPSIPPVIEGRRHSRPDTIMDEGDLHSGSHGYSPNTAYPETQYGSNFDEDADWNEGDER